MTLKKEIFQESHIEIEHAQFSIDLPAFQTQNTSHWDIHFHLSFSNATLQTKRLKKPSPNTKTHIKETQKKILLYLVKKWLFHK